MTPAWITALITTSATELEKSGKARFRFAGDIVAALAKNPIQDWESNLWARGLRLGLLRLEGHFFRAGAGKSSCLSFFVRNADGLQVGLRREALTQAATYVSLITDYGYPRDRTRFETGWMDVAVFDDAGAAWIYAENKAASRTLDMLCRRLEGEFADHLPAPAPDESPQDPVMKAHHIWRHRPRYFWGVCPTGGKPYAVDYFKSGFTLRTVERVPAALEWDAAAPLTS